MKKPLFWLLLTVGILGFGHQLLAMGTTTTVSQTESLRIVYVGAINGYLKLCG